MKHWQLNMLLKCRNTTTLSTIYLKNIYIDKEVVLHFRASCLHTTDVAQIEKAHLFVHQNNIRNFNVFLHLAFSDMLILIPDNEWKTVFQNQQGYSKRSDVLRRFLV